MITPAQCRAARELLQWTQEELHRRSGVGLSTVRYFESGKRTLHQPNVDAIERVMVEAGIEFIPATRKKGVGVRFAERQY